MTFLMWFLESFDETGAGRPVISRKLRQRDRAQRHPGVAASRLPGPGQPGCMPEPTRAGHFMTLMCRGFSTLHRLQPLFYTPAPGLGPGATWAAPVSRGEKAVALVRRCIGSRFVIALTVRRSTRVHYCT